MSNVISLRFAPCDIRRSKKRSQLYVNNIHQLGKDADRNRIATCMADLAAECERNVKGCAEYLAATGMVAF